MNLDIEEVLEVSKAHVFQLRRAEDPDQTYERFSAAMLAARIHALITLEPMKQEEICKHFGVRGCNNTVIIDYLLNTFCWKSRRVFLWHRDEFGYYHPDSFSFP